MTVPSLRRSLSPEREPDNTQRIIDELDLIDERRDSALVRIQNYRQRRFHEGDRVLRKIFQNTDEPNARKLGANWEGLYLISKVVRPGVYELADLSGKAIPRSWNAMHLRIYYN